MVKRLANIWSELRERVTRWRTEAARRGAAAREAPGVTPENTEIGETARVLQQWLECGRVDLTRERRAVERQHLEIEELKAEVVRLHLDNRALLNSLLGTAGIPPLEVPRTGAEAPVRRPSWPQIAAKREATAARAAAARQPRARAKEQEKH